MKKIKLAYSDLYNAGDLMNVDIVEHLSKYKVERSKTHCADMTAIGGAIFGLQYSDDIKKRVCQRVLKLIYDKKPIYIWGSGFWHDRNQNKLFRSNLKVCALRGKKTQEKLEHLTGRKFDVPLADAGLLIDELIELPIGKKHKVGLIPHMSQQDEAAMKGIGSNEDIHIINIKDTPQAVGREIASCEAVLSSSLHGLIFADALGVPNLHIRGEHDLPEGNFKFEDYYSSYGLEDNSFFLKDHFPSFEEIMDSYRIDPRIVAEKKRQLIESFPSEYRR